MKHILSFEDDKIVYLTGNETRKSITVKKVEIEELASEEYEAKKAALSFLVERCRLRNKKVDVVLPSKGLLLRELYVPNVRSKKRQRELVSNEMLYYHSNLKEFAIDYFPNGHVDDDGLKGFIACAINKPVFDEYMGLLQEVGIKPVSLDLAPDCIAKMISSSEYANQPLVFIEINNSHTELYLLDRGCAILVRRLNFKYASFSGNIQILAEELAEHTHKLLQFQNTRRITEGVSRVLISGDIPELEQLAPLIQNELEMIRPGELTCAVLPLASILITPAGIDAALCLKAAGALRKSEVNLLKSTDQQERVSLDFLSGSRNRAVIFLGVYTFLLLILPFSAGKIYEYVMATKTAEVIAASNDAEKIAEYQRLQEVQQQYLALKSENDAMDAKREAIESLAQVNDNTYAALNAPLKTGMWISEVAFSAYNNMLTVTFRAPEEGQSTSYVEMVRNQDHFASVAYTGWFLDRELLKIVVPKTSQTQSVWDAGVPAYLVTTPSGLYYAPGYNSNYASATMGTSTTGQSNELGEYEFTLNFVMRGAD